METFDILVLGGGPGGYSLAIAAAKKGQKVALFEKEHRWDLPERRLHPY